MPISLKFVRALCLVYAAINTIGCNLRRPSAQAIQNKAFAHTGITGNCASCHDSGKSFSYFPESGHPATNGQDCVACHTTSSWKKGIFSHVPPPTECASCHGNGQANGAVPARVANEMNHSHAGLPDCISCHAANAGSIWSGATYSHSPAPTSCQDCHEAQRPSGPIGNTGFDHATNGTGDCVGCHLANTGRTWASGSLSHTPVPTSCLSCHSGEMPSSTVAVGVTGSGKNRYRYFHSSLVSECKDCHTVKTSNIGNSWSSGYFDHQGNGITKASDCAPCHLSHGEGTSCGGCHGVSWPTKSPSGNYGGGFSGG